MSSPVGFASSRALFPASIPWPVFRRQLAVRGKSHPWPFPTRATPENAEGFRGCQAPHPAAAGFIHSLLAPQDAAGRVGAGCHHVGNESVGLICGEGRLVTA